MFDEGYVKIPIARYEQLRGFEKAAEEELVEMNGYMEKFTRVTDRTTVKDEKRTGIFVAMKEIKNVEIDLEEMEKAVVEYYEQPEVFGVSEVFELTIKNGDKYTTKEIRK